MKVYLIGAGPGDPGLFTLKGKRVLSRADVVVYDYLASKALLEYTRQDAELIYAGKKGGKHTLSQEKINTLLVRKAREGKIVARLKGGDPYIFGRGGEEAEELFAAGVPFEVIPGVTSGIAGPAYAGIPLTHRAYSSSVSFITGHEDPTKTNTSLNWQALAAGASTLVFYMGMRNLPDISRKLIEAGLPPDTPAAVIRHGTTARHRSLVSTIRGLPEEAARHGLTAPVLIVVGGVVALHDTLNVFEKRPLFGKGIVVTRAREQASGMVAQLQELGADVLQFPTITVAPLANYDEVHSALRNLASYHLLIFTSVNGVRRFQRQLALLGLDARALHGLQVAAIGPATAKAVAAMGIIPDVVPEHYIAESVAERILTQFGPDMSALRVLLPRAREAREVLPKKLETAGACVHVLPIYNTHIATEQREEVLAKLETGGIQCISFTSSSTVTNFLSLIPPETLKIFPDLKFACIGPITSGALEKAGLPCHIQPDEYTVPALVQAIAEKL